MSRKLAGLIIFLLLSACTFVPYSGYLEQNARAVTVLLVVPNGYGAGVLVAHDKVLTANHLLSTDKALVYFYEGTDILTSMNTFLVGEVIWRSETTDLALLSIPPVSNVSPVNIACQLPEIGTPVFLIGHSGFEIKWAARYGNVASSDINSYGALILYMTTAAGDSGAGVFNHNNRLVGIMIARQLSTLSRNDGFSFMIPGSKICEETASRL